jgi:FkbM family methyltransferase
MTTTTKYPIADGLKGVDFLQQALKRTAEKLGVDEHFMRMRAAVNPKHKRNSLDGHNLRLLLAFAVSENANCIDIGANRGSVLAEIVRIAPQGKHIAYEPLPFLHKHLVKRFPCVEVRQAAVSNETGEQSFTMVKHDPGYSGLHARSFAHTHHTETLIVHTETLDENLPQGYIPSLIKIDVEGAERLVIEGAMKTISAYKPIVVFEHGKGGANYYNTRPGDIYKLLHDEAQLRIFNMDGDGPYTLDQFKETYARGDHWNFVACR